MQILQRMEFPAEFGLDPHNDKVQFAEYGQNIDPFLVLSR